MRRSLLVPILIAIGFGCGDDGPVQPDAAVVELTCDDPALLDDLRDAVVALPDSAFVDPVQLDARILGAIGSVAGFITAGDPRYAAFLLEDIVRISLQDVASQADREPLLLLLAEASATLARPTLACPTTIVVACVPPGGKAISYGVAAADCTDSMPAIVCTPASGSTVTPGDSAGSCTATAADGAAATCAFTVHAVPEGQPAITSCPADVTAACTGSLTSVTLGEPTVEGCGDTFTVGRAGGENGFAIGASNVDWSATGPGGSDSCQTVVTITDDEPPQIVCPAGATVVRTAAGAVVAPPPPTVTDNCDDRGLYTAWPIDLPPGTTVVEYGTTDLAGRSATCTASITVVDAFAVENLQIARASLSAVDGTTSVILAWDRTFSAAATGYRIERAPDAAGPWATVGSAAIGTQIFSDILPAGGAHYRVVTLAGALDGGIAAPIRGWPIAATGYDLGGQSVPTVPFATTLYGVVRHPVDLSGGPFPFVLLIHGNHGICRPSGGGDDYCATSNDGDCPFGATTPNAEGMVFQAETLAAQGYVAVTISANALNCRNDYIMERAQLVIEHLRRWRTWHSAGGGAPFGTMFVGAVDLSRVGLVGHSRGGEAVAQVPALLTASPIDSITVGSVYSIAPTDYHTPDPDGAAYAVLLPACDGDVATLAGMHIYDRTLDSPDARVQTMFAGANHNFFSTEWLYDDNGDGAICDVSDEVGAYAQQGMLAATLGHWFAGTLLGAPLASFLRAETPALGISAVAAADLDLRWSYAAPMRAAIDDFTGPSAPDVNNLGGANSFTGYSSLYVCTTSACDNNFDHQVEALRMSWSATGATAVFNLGGLDPGAFPYLSFRIVSRESTLNDPFLAQDFRITLIETVGAGLSVDLSDITRVPYLYPTNVPREILQTVRIPISGLGPLDRLELTMDLPTHDTGSVILTEVSLSE